MTKKQQKTEKNKHNDTGIQKQLEYGGIALVVGLILILGGYGFYHAYNNNLSKQMPGHTYRVAQSFQGKVMPKRMQPKIKILNSHKMKATSPSGQTATSNITLKPKYLITKRNVQTSPKHPSTHVKSAMKLIHGSGSTDTMHPAYTVINGKKHAVPKAQASMMTIKFTKIK